MDPVTHNRHPIAIAGGGGGLAARISHNDSIVNTSPHGLPPNASILPINGYTGSGAGKKKLFAFIIFTINHILSRKFMYGTSYKFTPDINVNTKRS